MRLITNFKLSGYLLIFVVAIGFTVFMPQASFAQSEEDILNSIGSELEDESSKKKAAAKVEKEYKALKTKADASFKSKRYDKAKEYYGQMLVLKPDSDYATSRIALSDQKISEAKEAELLKKYQAKIKQADLLLSSEKWDEASAKYKEASGLQPDESYPKTQLAKISKLAAEAKAAAAAALIQKKYDATLATAEKALSAKSWDVAKSKFLEASKIKPAESYPKEKAAMIDMLKAEAIAKARALKITKEYNAQIVKADQLFSTHKWNEAIASYQLAQGIKASETYPKAQITKANERIKVDLENKKKADALESEFAKHKKLGEDALAKKNWLLAIESFKAAGALKPQNSDIIKLLGSAKSGKKAADDMALKQKSEEDARVKVQKQYENELAIGKDAMANKEWDRARLAFNKAKNLKPDETAPKDGLLELGKRIAEENAAIADAAAKKKAEEEAEKARLAEEARLIAEKDAAEKAQKEEQARLAAIAAEAEKARMEEEARLAAEAASTAKAKKLAAEAAEKARLEEEAKIAAEKKAVEEARLAEEAKVAAQAAESEEKDRLAKVAAEKAKAEEEAKIAAENAEAEKQKLAKEAELAALAAAETKAKQEAQKKESERLAKEKADAEEQRLAEETRIAAQAKLEKEEAAAEELKLANEAESQRLAEENARKQKEFDQAVIEYKKAIKNSEWDLALRAVTAAESFFPENPKVAKMQLELNALQQAEKDALALEKAKETKAKELDQAYQNLVAKGDKSLASKDYQSAKKNYEEAMKLKPSADYPKTQLAEIKQLVLAEDAAALEKQQEIDANFKKLLADGDQFISDKNWSEAKASFTNAKKLKPESTIPTKRIADIAKLIQKEKDAEAQAANLEADFQERMKNGNTALNSNKFAEAKRFYFGASKLKPNAEEPKEKLKETETKWAEFIASEKLAAAQKKKAEAEANYTNSIASGDMALTNQMWDEAINSYQAAIAIKSKEAYPKEKLSEAKKGKSEALAAAKKMRAANEARLIAEEKERIEKQALADQAAQLESDFANAIKEGGNAMSTEDFRSAVKAYQRAVRLKPENTDAIRKLDFATEKYKASEKVRHEKEQERKRLAQIELTKRQEDARIKREAYLKELHKNSPEELAKNYPDGITEEIDSEHEMVITKSIIVENGEGRYLIRFDYPWGEHFYYLNGKKIREDAYNWNVRKFKF